jgi:hypothetical protein
MTRELRCVEDRRLHNFSGAGIKSGHDSDDARGMTHRTSLSLSTPVEMTLRFALGAALTKVNWPRAAASETMRLTKIKTRRRSRTHAGFVYVCGEDYWHVTHVAVRCSMTSD